MKTFAKLVKMTAINVTYRFRKARTTNSTPTNGHIQTCIKIKDVEFPPLTTHHNISLVVWENYKEPKKKTTPDIQKASSILKKELDDFVNTIRTTYEVLESQGFTNINAKDLVYYNIKTTERQKKQLKVNNLVSLLEAFLQDKEGEILKERIKERIKNKVTQGTFNNYKKFCNKINNYLSYSKQKYIHLNNVDNLFLKGFEKWLDNVEKDSNAYSAKAIKFLKQVLDYAVTNKYASVNHLALIKTFSGDSKDPFNIIEEDIDKIENYPSYDYIEKRYVFAWLLARELALHFVDYADLSNEDFIQMSFQELAKARNKFYNDMTIIRKDDAVWTFEKKRMKTKIHQNSVFSDRALRMFDYFEKNVLLLPLNKKYSSISSFSRILRPAIQKALNTDIQYVFSHARDSKIYELLRAGSSDRLIMAVAGWRKMDELHRYARVDNQIMLDEYMKKAS